MTDVFISYSRRDKEFVQRLHEALLKQQRDVWIDWEDIPPTADWRAEIRGGIEASNAVMFVISPDSVRSKECRVELELALENGKRFIPVMYRMVTDEADKAAMHPSLNSHNWVYLRDEDDFDAGFQTMVKALDTDLAYIRAHTRLLVRAREWMAEKQDSSLLLRGKDLIEAEAWLASGVQVNPPPTPLHSDYVASSRRAETRRGRRLLIGVSVALAVSAALAVLAFGQWQQAASNLELANVRGTQVAFQVATSDSNALLAQNNAATADANAIRAQSSESTAVYQGGVAQAVALAAQAQLSVDGDDPERGVLLALESLKNYPYTAQAEYALSLAVQKVIPSQVLPGSKEFQANVYWSPDSLRLAVVNDSNSGIDLWSAETGEKITSLTEPNKHLFKAAWSPDGTRIATSADDRTTVVWDANWQPQFQVDGIGALWSPDGTRIATFITTFMVWDAQTGAALYSMGEAGDVFALYQPMAWSPDSTRLATGNVDGSITIWNVADWTPQFELRAHQDVVNVINWSPDGRRLISGSGNFVDFGDGVNASAYVWDAETGEAIWELNDGNYSSAVINAEWSPDGKYILSGSVEFTDVWDAETAENIFYVGGFNAHWSPDSTEILVNSLESNQAIIYDAASGFQTRVLASHSASVITGLWSPDRFQIATASLDGTVRLWSPDNTALLSLDDSIYAGLAWSLDSKSFWVADLLDGTTQEWELETGTLLTDLNQSAAGIAQNGEPLTVIVNPTTYQLTVTDFDDRVISTFSGHTTPIFRVTWSPDASTIASSGTDNRLFVWDAQTGQQKFQIAGRTAFWSPDGTRIVVISVDDIGDDYGKDSITIRDPNTGELQKTIPIVPQESGDTFANFAIWSPDGKMLATSTEPGFGLGGLVEIWDTTTWERLYTMKGLVLAWSPDGTRIASVQQDGTVKVQTLTGEMVYSIADEDETLDSVSWSPNGRYLATADKRNSIKVWRIVTSTQELIDYAQACCVLRELTDAERVEYGLPAKQ